MFGSFEDDILAMPVRPWRRWEKGGGAGFNQTGAASSPGRSGDQISPYKRHTILDIGPVNIFNLKKKGKKEIERKML